MAHELYKSCPTKDAKLRPTPLKIVFLTSIVYEPAVKIGRSGGGMFIGFRSFDIR
jgi:hypothetical protein